MRGVIFDLDGTLLDSMGMWEALDRNFLRSHGIEPPEDISNIVKKMTFEASARYFVDRFSLPMTPYEVIGEIEGLAEEEYRCHLQLKPDALSVLKALKARRIPCGLASVTYPELLDAALQRLKLIPYFQKIVTNPENGAGKHNSAMYDEIAEEFALPPGEILVLEDALYAAESAKRAGYFTVGFRDPVSRADWPALERCCDAVIDSWKEFFPLLSLYF